MGSKSDRQVATVKIRAVSYTHLDVYKRQALKAGENILSIYDDPASDFEIERKADNSPLTIADRKAHEAIVAI